MALVAAKGVITAPTTNGNTSVVNLPARFTAGQALKAVWLFTSGATATGAQDGNAQWCDGYVTNRGGTVQQAFRFSNDEDNTANSQVQRGINTTAALSAMSDDATTDYVASCTAFSSTSFTLTWSNAPASAIKVHYLALGGDDLEDAYVFTDDFSPSSQTAYDVPLPSGFGQPDVVFLSATNGGVNALTDGAGGHGGIVQGVMTDTASRAALYHLGDGTGDMRPAVANLAKALPAVGATSNPTAYIVEAQHAASGWPTDGFRLDTSTNAPTVSTDFIGLALRFSADVTVTLTTGNSRTTTGTTLHTSSAGSIVAAVAFGVNEGAAGSAPTLTGTDLGAYFAGAFVAFDSAQGTAAIAQRDADATSTAGRYHSETRTITEIIPAATSGTTPPSVAGDATGSASSGTLTLDWTDADTSARQYSILLLAGPAAATNVAVNQATTTNTALPITRQVGTAPTDPYGAAVWNTSGLVGYWRHSDLTGTTLTDHSPNQLHGTLVDAPTLNRPTLVAGGDPAIEYDGLTERAEVADHALLDVGDVYTLEAWVKYLGDGGGIVSKGPNGFYFRIHNTGTVELLRCERQVLATSSVVLTSGSTFHLVAVQSGSSTSADFKLYINAVEDTAANKRTPSATTVSTALPLSIGCNTSSTTPSFNEFLNAVVDEVAVYDRVLTGTEISNHYALGTSQVRVVGRVTETDVPQAVSAPGAISRTVGQVTTENTPGAVTVATAQPTRFSALSNEVSATPLGDPVAPPATAAGARDTWAWVLADHAGQPLPGAHVARGRRLIYGRNQPAEARLTLSMTDRACLELFAALKNGTPRLLVYRNAVLVFSGLWDPMAGGHDTGEQSFTNLVFRDAVHTLHRRFTHGQAVHHADQGTIARDLIEYTNLVHGDTGIATNPNWITPTKARERSYEHKSIGEAISELTEVLDGLDWWPTYLDPRSNNGKSLRFNAAARQGVTRTNVRFEYGTGTINNSVGYQFSTSRPVNRVRVIGAEQTVQTTDEDGNPVTVGTGVPLTYELADAASEARYGTYMEVVSATDVSEEATLADKARDALRPEPAHVTEIRPDPGLAPQPWDGFWIGDDVIVNVDDGAFQIQQSARVQTIEVGLSESDTVDDLTVGFDPAAAGAYLAPAWSTRRFVQQQRELNRRLSALER